MGLAEERQIQVLLLELLLAVLFLLLDLFVSGFMLYCRRKKLKELLNKAVLSVTIL